MLLVSLVVVYSLFPGAAPRRVSSKRLGLQIRGSRRCGTPPGTNANSEYSQDFAGNVEVAVYDCVDDFQRYGKRFSYCRRGNWSDPAPYCYRSGCSDLEMTNLLFEKLPNRLYTNVRCFPGYSPSNRTFTIACLGKTWDVSPPRCRKQALLVNLPHTCNFENDQCRWKSDMITPLYWRRNKGKTPTPGTGPQRDHSRPKPGHYMYMETTNIGETGFADLYSPMLEGNMSALLGGGKRCFSFWYHMHGAGIGNLSVLLRFDKDTLDEAYILCTIRGPQGDQWRNFQARLPDTKRDYQLIIRGDPGGQDEGDIGLDDIFIGASCLLTSEPALELELPPDAYGDKSSKQGRTDGTTGLPTSTHGENETMTAPSIRVLDTTMETTTAAPRTRARPVPVIHHDEHSEPESSTTPPLPAGAATLSPHQLPRAEAPSSTSLNTDTWGVTAPEVSEQSVSVALAPTTTPSTRTQLSEAFLPTAKAHTSGYSIRHSRILPPEPRSTEPIPRQTPSSTSTGEESSSALTPAATESSSMLATTRSYSSSSSRGSDGDSDSPHKVNDTGVSTRPRSTDIPRRLPIVPAKAPVPDTGSVRRQLVEQILQQDRMKRQEASTSALPILPAIITVGLLLLLTGFAAVLYFVRRNKGNSFRVLQAESQMSLPMDWIAPQQASGGMVEPVLDYHYNRGEVDYRYECRTKLLPLTAI